MRRIQVILAQDVPNLGKTGEIKDVKPGFARHFLIPQNKAYFLDDPKAKEIFEIRKTKKSDSSKQDQEISQILKDLKDKKFIFKVRVNKQGRPFRSINAKEIARKIGVNEKLIQTEPIEKTGLYEILLKKGNQEKKITIEITAEK